LALLPEAAALEDKLPRLNIPTLILFGEHDKVVPPANAELLSEKIANSKVVILPNAGHFFPIEIPEAAARAVIDFAA
jgi:pimeloyl-ACP methyl ester carboxylesterase